ncbi:hypothetical protein SAMN05444156_0374 [Verrucomicrobium sp. GAS474]|uniref:hypothetical protein n=1 Tax=Verrucomicrobium sp. GAS474 TaxID=1882831 RepID=UPI00087DB120|nr:hypothetical protein [Verrucomicrobium sp. GAS474]SDT88069.1 hypothetical protein SAMN05444156_0374 [Verrucomicrobium sp. GAS474]
MNSSLILAQIEVDPELARKLGLICSITFAWGGWLLLLLAGVTFLARYPNRDRRPLGWLALGIVLPLSLPALLAGPALLSATGNLKGIDAALLYCFYGYEVLFMFLSVSWGTLLYMKWVRQWSGWSREDA